MMRIRVVGCAAVVRVSSFVRDRAVVVELRFPHLLPSASSSEGVVDVSRLAGGYRVWNVVH